MNPSFLLTHVFVVAFAGLVAFIGWRMLKISSYKSAIEHYEKAPAQADWFVKYFLGYAFPFQIAFQKAAIQAVGDGIVSAFYRLAGVFFILVGIAGAFMSISLIAQNV